MARGRKQAGLRTHGPLRLAPPSLSPDFPAKASVTLWGLVPIHRCGAALELHQIPFSSGHKSGHQLWGALWTDQGGAVNCAPENATTLNNSNNGMRPQSLSAANTSDFLTNQRQHQREVNSRKNHEPRGGRSASTQKVRGPPNRHFAQRFQIRCKEGT
jgi:hypothetical protein